jgi:hypothetical protein
LFKINQWRKVWVKVDQNNYFLPKTFINTYSKERICYIVI